jgi:ABC-2 type transport system ATP-binding protein
MVAGEATDVAIRCSGLSKHYGDVIALKGLDLTVPYGSIFGFLGRNGAGKTTTIRLLAGLARPTAGSVMVAGVETTNGDSEARERFGYLPQDPAFYSWMTPYEYLDHVGRLFGMAPGPRKRRVGELLELVDLQDSARRRIGGFSGGMHQRLGIAQALIHKPPVLLLDEPTSSLDPVGRYEVLDLLDSLRNQATVFLSSHILADVERICDTIGIIHLGELVLLSGRDELLGKFAANAVVLEFDPACMPIPEGFLESLENETWTSGFSQDQHIVRVTAEASEESKRALLGLIAEHGLVLNRYEWVRPSLEEIFMRMSA